MIYLKKIENEPDIKIYNMLQEIKLNDNGFHNKACGMSFEEFSLWLKNEYEVDNGKLKDWMVPQTSYWMYEDGTPVGYGRLRHYLNDNLKENSGHIGYAVPLSKRHKGYGNEILKLLIKEAEKIGIKELQIGANTDNIPSNKVIKKNGGTLIREKDGKNFYLIKLY